MSILANITKHIGTLGLLCGLAPFMVHAQHRERFAPAAIAAESLTPNEAVLGSQVLVLTVEFAEPNATILKKNWLATAGYDQNSEMKEK